MQRSSGGAELGMFGMFGEQKEGPMAGVRRVMSNKVAGPDP